jgi:hypothetical protein
LISPATNILFGSLFFAVPHSSKHCQVNAKMRFESLAVLLGLAAVQVAALPIALPEVQTPLAEIGVPRMITPKYRSTAKRAIIRYPAFTLAAKGVRNFGLILQGKDLTGSRKAAAFPWTPTAKEEC